MSPQVRVQSWVFGLRQRSLISCLSSLGVFPSTGFIVSAALANYLPEVRIDLGQDEETLGPTC
jgi:hypothetical protein